MFTKADYIKAEISHAIAELRKMENAPLHHRREARDALREDVKNPELIAERAAWLANGSYGAGQCYLMAQQLANCTTPLQRRVLMFTRMAALDNGCPERFAVQVYKEQTPELRARIDALTDAAVADFLADNATKEG